MLGQEKVDVEPEPEPVVISTKTLSRPEINLCKAMLLAVCYSASLGGTATLTGSPPNIIMTGLMTKRYGNAHPLNFASWMGYNLPGTIINTLLAWCWLQILFLGPKSVFQCRKRLGASSLKLALQEDLSKLGPMTFGEWSVIGWFLVLLFLWLTRSFLWGKLFARAGVPYVSDGTSAMIVALVLFAWPKNMPRSLHVPASAILQWDLVQKRVYWGVILLLGGAFAISAGVKSTGLSTVLAGTLSTMTLSNFCLCAMSLISMMLITEFACGAATSTILVPIVMALAESRCLNPLYLTLPVSAAASFAFMFPVATPPNAIVFASGILRIVDMMIAGFVMNLVCMSEVLLGIHTWGWVMFHLGDYPPWAAAVSGNGTCF